MKRRVVITGMGIWSCLGTTLDEVKDSLYQGKSALYQNPSEGRYYLFLTMEDMDVVKSMQHVLAVISEYGHCEPISYAREQHLKEHCVVICPENALTQLSAL